VGSTVVVGWAQGVVTPPMTFASSRLWSSFTVSGFSVSFAGEWCFFMQGV
jgi:hypothetical protein